MAYDITTKDGITIRNIPDDVKPDDPSLKSRVAGIRARMAQEADNKRFEAETRKGATGGFFENLAAGSGKALSDIGLGVRQIASEVGIGDKEAIQQEVDDRKRRDAALMETGGGMVGNIGTQIGVALAPGGLLRGAGVVAKSIPAVRGAAPALDAAGRFLASSPATLKGAATQAALGAGQAAVLPTGSEESRLGNMAVNAAAGAVVPLAGMAFKAGKAAIEPMYASGREAIVGRAMREATGSGTDDAIRAMSASGELVPGSAPTAAQVANSGGIAALERAASAIDPQAYAARDMQQNAARLAALRGVAGDDVALAAARQARDDAADALYGRAFQSDAMRQDMAAQLRNSAAPFAGAVGMPAAQDLATPGLRELMKRPMFAQAAAKAKELAANKGLDIGNPVESLQGLHYIKLALDDMLNPQAATKLGKNEAGAVMGMKAALTTELQKVAPLYGAARQTFADMSAPINQMEVGQYLLNKLKPALTDYGMPAGETAAAYAKALRDAPRTIKGSTGFKGFDRLDQVLTADQVATVENVARDLARKATAQNLGKGAGSDTVQKLAMTNILERSGIPTFIGELPVIRQGGKFIYGGADETMRQQLAQALLNPQEAARIMQNAAPNLKREAQIRALMMAVQPTMVGGTAGWLNAQ